MVKCKSFVGLLSALIGIFQNTSLNQPAPFPPRDQHKNSMSQKNPSYGPGLTEHSSCLFEVILKTFSWIFSQLAFIRWKSTISRNFSRKLAETFVERLKYYNLKLFLEKRTSQQISWDVFISQGDDYERFCLFLILKN